MGLKMDACLRQEVICLGLEGIRSALLADAMQAPGLCSMYLVIFKLHL